MIKGEYKDKKIVVNILSKAYDKNETINETIIQDTKRDYRLRVLMEYSFDIAYRFGQVCFSENKESVALIIFPETKKASLKTILLDIKLLLFCTGFLKAIRALSREKAIKKIHPQAPLIYYIWYFGTNPGCARKGIGSDLMNDLIEDSLPRKRTMCVEARIEQNMLWYQKFGFVIYHELVHRGRKWFCMKKEVEQISGNQTV